MSSYILNINVKTYNRPKFNHTYIHMSRYSFIIELVVFVKFYIQKCFITICTTFRTQFSGRGSKKPYFPAAVIFILIQGVQIVDTRYNNNNIICIHVSLNQRQYSDFQNTHDDDKGITFILCIVRRNIKITLKARRVLFGHLP